MLFKLCDYLYPYSVSFISSGPPDGLGQLMLYWEGGLTITVIAADRYFSS